MPFHALTRSVLLAVSDIVTHHGAEIAGPSSTRHLASVPDSGHGTSACAPGAGAGRGERGRAGAGRGDDHEGEGA